MKTRLTSLLAVVVLVLVMAVPAFAQNATQDGYTATAGQVQAQVDDESSSAPVAVTTSGGGGGGGSLPFTGLDVALLAGAGLLLVGAGLGMRRLTQAPGHGHA
jgi:predicted S18 family serine protease